jgi:hypothetical protein
MPYWRSLFVTFLVCASVVVTSAQRRQLSPLTAPPPVYPLCGSAEAAATLDRAIAALDPSRVQWLSATFWQQVNADPLLFEAEGTFQAGPGQRLRIDLQVRCGGARRSWQTICDGRTLWEIERNGTEPPSIQRRDAPQGKGWGERAGEKKRGFLCGLGGPLDLLRQLRRDVVFTHQEAIQWRQREVILLTGATAPPAGGRLPDFRPRQCRLVLDGATLWPHRVEWWGPAPGLAGDIRLVQMEFRQPILHQPVDGIRFTYAPAEPPG